MRLGLLDAVRRIGDRIEKYELVMPVARGGMGSVWAAKLHGPHGFEKIVAIKTVLPELASDLGARAMFLDEARLASAINHRNVARVIDFLEHEGALYLVMEWVDGTSLMALHERTVKRGARIPVGVALRIFADACAGLHAAHELTYTNGEPCNLVHRDVCPHNLLVATEGSTKLIDFGVAKTRFRVAPDSSIGALRGRVDFMAPEQALSDPLDRRADIWSIGASLYYLLAGHGPFGNEHRATALRRLLAGGTPLPPPSRTPPAVARVLSGCLARRREDRFPTAGHLGCAIEEAIESLGVAATATDVAEFLSEDGFKPDPSLLTTGRCAIPHELTFLRPDTVSNMRPVGWRPVWKGSTVRPRVALAAVIAAIGLGALGATQLRPRAEMPSSPAAPVPVEAIPSVAPSSPTVPTVVTPAVSAAASAAPAPAASSAQKTHPARPSRTKSRSTHDRSHSTP
jgi:serine/threonine-protein kinase